MTSEEILAQLKAGYEEELEVPDGFEVVEEGDWIQDYKYQLCDIYVQHKESGKYFCIQLCRAGSYFSDYEYSDPEFYEVKRLEETKVVVTWAPV